MALAIQDSSFLGDIEEAIFAEVLSVLGEDSVTYPTPKCVQIVFAGRTGGLPQIPRIESNLPGFWMEYQGGGSKKTEFGHGSRVPTFATEVWHCYVVLNLTPEKIGCERDEQAFYRYCSMAVDTLMRRLVKLLVDFDPNATDPVLGYVSNGQRVPFWSYVGVARGDLDIDWTIALRYESIVEM